MPKHDSPALLLFLTGFGAAAAGLALAAAPGVSPEFEKVAAAFSRMGLHSGSLLMGGLVLVALGMVSRSLANASEPAAPAAANANGSALAALSKDLGLVRQNQATLLEELAALHASAPAPQQASNGDQQQLDVQFRMAASLDQLGARMEQSQRALAAQLEARLVTFTQSIEDNRAFQASLHEWLVAATNAGHDQHAADSAAACAETWVDDGHQHASPAPVASARSAPKARPEPQELADEEDSSLGLGFAPTPAPKPSPTPVRPAPAPARLSLGLLDELDTPSAAVQASGKQLNFDQLDRPAAPPAVVPAAACAAPAPKGFPQVAAALPALPEFDGPASPLPKAAAARSASAEEGDDMTVIDLDGLLSDDAVKQAVQRERELHDRRPQS